MAAIGIGSSRRVLADLHVNKPPFPKQSSTTGSPDKLTSFTLNTVLNEKSSDLGRVAQEFVSPKIQDVSSTATSPLGGKKRGVACLEDAQDGHQRKKTVVGHSKSDWEGTLSGSDGDCESRPLEGEVASDHGQHGRSVSPDSSFDATQDSEFLDSQNTTLTEPEDLAPLPHPAFTAVHSSARRMISQEEARENAEALRLRLKVAMYKVQTNQTDLPLSQLQIRSSRGDDSHSRQLTRNLSLGSRSAPEPKHDDPMNPTRLPPPGRDVKTEELTKIPSSSLSPSPQPMGPGPSASHDPVHGDLATPTLMPRSPHGSLILRSRGSLGPGPDATGSVDKGQAADGLLSLMAAGPQRAQ